MPFLCVSFANFAKKVNFVVVKGSGVNNVSFLKYLKQYQKKKTLNYRVCMLFVLFIFVS